MAAAINVAEAAKVIENTQRDVNIALMNELSIIFHKLGIDKLAGFCRKGATPIVVDIKGMFDPETATTLLRSDELRRGKQQGVRYWRL